MGHIVKADDGGFTGANPGEIKNSGHRPIMDTSDGLLVYSRRKRRGRCNGARVNGFLVYRRKKKPKAHSITDNTQATEVSSSSNGTNDSDLGTDGSSSPFRRCKLCDKAGNVERMLICDECEEAYHTRCCGVGMKEVAETGSVVPV